jgi:hypothetical protein
MSKIKLIIVVLIALVLAAGGGYYYFKIRPQPIVSQLNDTPTPTPTSTVNEIIYKIYEDEAGFSFSYPENVTVSQKDLEDESIYSSLELTNPEYPEEKLIIKVSDTTQKTVDKWLKTIFKEEQIGSSEAKLATLNGIKVNYPKSLVFIAIDSNISFFVQSPKSNVFWTNTFEKILDSFVLDIAPKTTTSTSGISSSSTSDIIDEGEEIVQ